MSYRSNGLGYPFTAQIPFVGAKTFNLPLESAVEKATSQAVDQLSSELPTIIDNAMPTFQKSVFPPLVAQAKAAVQPIVKKAIDDGLVQADAIGTRVAWLTVIGLAVPLAASTWYLRREIRKGK